MSSIAAYKRHTELTPTSPIDVLNSTLFETPYEMKPFYRHVILRVKMNNNLYEKQIHLADSTHVIF